MLTEKTSCTPQKRWADYSGPDSDDDKTEIFLIRKIYFSNSEKILAR